MKLWPDTRGTSETTEKSEDAKQSGNGAGSSVGRLLFTALVTSHKLYRQCVALSQRMILIRNLGCTRNSRDGISRTLDDPAAASDQPSALTRRINDVEDCLAPREAAKRFLARIDTKN